MKTQEIFKYTATKNIKVKDDNGQIESIRKEILGTGTMPAYNEANASVKVVVALTLAKIITAETDIDEVEVLVRPFCQNG